MAELFAAGQVSRSETRPVTHADIMAQLDALANVMQGAQSPQSFNHHWDRIIKAIRDVKHETAARCDRLQATIGVGPKRCIRDMGHGGDCVFEYFGAPL